MDISIFSTVLFVVYCGRYFSSLAAYRDRTEKENAEKTRKLFSASMNHELRSPLNSIIGNTQILLMDQTIKPENREMLQNVFDSSQNMVQLVNDLLDFSKLEAGEFEIVPKEFNLKNLAENLDTMFVNLAGQKELDFAVSIKEETPIVLKADSTRIQQIAVNIISNGIKYTSEGFVKVEFSVENERLKMVIADSGQGIAKEAIDDLFSPFKRINEGKNSNIQGTGLGMFIVSNLLKQMNGTIDLESEVGKGSTFTVEIPAKILVATEVYHSSKDGDNSIRKASIRKEVGPAYTETQKGVENSTGTVEKPKPKAAPVVRSIPRNSKYNFEGKKILSVDDTVMNNRIIQNLLAPTGADVYCIGDGERCLKFLEHNMVDLILLDHMMPGMDGVECMKRIRQRPELKDISIIMVTGNSGGDFEKLYATEGANGFLTKPIMQEALLEIVNKEIGPGH